MQNGSFFVPQRRCFSTVDVRTIRLGQGSGVRRYFGFARFIGELIHNTMEDAAKHFAVTSTAMSDAEFAALLAAHHAELIGKGAHQKHLRPSKSQDSN